MAGTKLSAPPELRAKWYLQADKHGRTIDEVCNIFGISRKTYYKWYGRDHPFGKTGRPPRRMHPQTILIGAVAVFVMRYKRQFNFGPHKMSAYLKKRHNVIVSHQSIYEFYKKKNLIRKPRKKLAWYTPLTEPYLALEAGENVQLDVKYVPAPHGEWLYQYRFKDVVTNMQYAINMEHKDARSTIEAFYSAVRSFPFVMRGIQTDNGSEFRGVFHQFLIRKNIPHRFIPKRSAPWNGKVERDNRSVDDEFYLNWGKPWKRLHQYTDWYNHDRPHEGKNMNYLTPYEKFLSLSVK